MSTTSAPPAPVRSAASAPAHAPGHRRAVISRALSGRFRMLPVLISLLVLWVIFQVQSDAFLSARNLSNLSVQIVVTAMLAVGLVLVLLIGEIDLSVAALSGMSAAVMGKLLVDVGLSAWTAMGLAVVAGLLVGLLQGVVVTAFNAPAFIVTLGSSLVIQAGLLQLLPRTGQYPLAGTPVATLAGSYLVGPVGWAAGVAVPLLVTALLYQSHRHKQQQGLASSLVATVLLPGLILLAVSVLVVFVLGRDRGVPTPVAILLALLGVMAFVTTQTRFGTYLYAVGGNAEASRRAGIPVRRVKIITFGLAGVFSAVAGVLAASRTLGVSAQSGVSGTLLLEAVAAAVIGGASLFGGRGSVWAALLGALVIGSVANGLDLLGASTVLKLSLTGAILMAAVMVDGIISRADRTRAT